MDTPDNVIALTENNLAARQRQLADCQGLLRDLLRDWLNAIRGVVLEELQSLAAGKSGSATQRTYLGLRHDLQDHWHVLIEAVGEKLTAANARAAISILDHTVSQLGGLHLLDDCELAEQIVVREFAARLSETCSQELYGLERRVAVILGREEPVGSDENPLGPQAVCEALNFAGDSLASIREDATLRPLLLRRFEQHLHTSLPGMYQEVNALLIKRGILPDLKQTFRRKPSAAMPARTHGDPASPAAANAAGGGEQVSNEMLALIQRLAATQNPGGGTGDGTSGGLSGGSSAVGGMTGAGMVAATPALKNEDFVAALEKIQHIDWSSLPAAMPAGSNLVWQVRNSQEAGNVGHIESATIDIVAMLFDFIFEDDEVPAGVKALIGRLQIPVLKVALLDQAFFASREHPARYFLDDISGISLRWGGEVRVDDPFYLKLEELVTRIQHEFAEDIEVFSVAIDELEAFVDEHEAAARPALAAVTETVAQRELEMEAARLAQEAAHRKAEAAVKPWLDKPIFPPIRDFFETHWLRVMEKLALDAPGDDVAWAEAVDFMENLAWSISLKSRQQRNKLVALLPKLLSSINQGLDRIGVSASERQPFMDMLFDLHSANVKAAMSAPGGALPEPEARYIPAPANQADGQGELVVTRLLNNGVEVEEITLVGRLPASEQSLRTRVQTLQRGDWVEFRPDGEAPFRARLNWISPQKGLLVFVPQTSGKAVSISPEALASQLGDGKALLIEGETLFERALGGVMQTLKKEPASATASLSPAISGLSLH